MSFSIDKTNIYLTKGDTFHLPVHFHQSLKGARITVEIYQKEGLAPLIQEVITSHLDEDEGKTLITIPKEKFDPLLIGDYKILMRLNFLDGTSMTFYPASPVETAVFHLTSAI